MGDDTGAEVANDDDAEAIRQSIEQVGRSHYAKDTVEVHENWKKLFEF